MKNEVMSSTSLLILQETTIIDVEQSNRKKYEKDIYDTRSGSYPH